MIWRLTYCNKKGVEARIDIIKGDRTPVEIVQGSGQPFTLSYKLDKNDKSGHIMTSSADIEIFETDTFNIDDLKTSNETELKVEYFEGNILTWSGFVLPDFFSREIGSPNIVRMTASDRLTALKGVTLSDLPSRVSLRDLIELSLAQTGLSLGLVSQIQISQGSTNILDSEILSQRLTDVRGRSISCYDILMSIMVGTNSTIRQRKGQWQVYNKLEHELRTPTIFFDKVEKGAIRTIQPVASSVGVYQEYGGGRLHPSNYDFAQGGSGWVNKNGFSYTISNQKPASYSVGTPNHTVAFGESDRNRMMIMGIVLPFWQPDIAPHVENKFPVITSNEDSVKITIDISVLGWGYWGSFSTGRFIILAEKDDSRLAFNPSSGSFEEFDNQATAPNSSEPPYVIKLKPSANKVGDTYPVTNKSVKYETVLEKANLSDYTISIRIYGTSGFTGPTAPLFINFANIRFSNTEEAPRGTLYKTVQGSNFTKEHEISTVLWGDYINSGLNGYFYDYPIDDTSNLHLPSGELSPPQWITAFDATERPLLHHISRQKSNLFSVAHDILKANINVDSFDPLAVFQDCKGGKYVVVSASFDFLRSEVDVELEQIAYDNTILKRDFIYSYFGDGESGIKSIGGISGGSGGGSTGGGLTPEQIEILSFWKKDPDRDNTIFTEMNAYSTGELSAYGIGAGGGSGGGIIETVYSYSNLGQSFDDATITDTFNAYTINQINTRLVAVESGGGGGDYNRLDTWADYDSTKSGWVLSAFLGNDLNTRVTALENSGGGGGTVVSWGTELNGGIDLTVDGISKTLALHSALTDKQDKLIAGSGITIVGNTISSTATGGGDGEFWKLDENGNLFTEYNAYSTKEISAYGIGSGGGGGGDGIIETVYRYGDLGQTFNNNILTDTFNAYTINQLHTRLSAVESGAALSIVQSGTGNAVTSVTKSGTALTVTKGLNFSQVGHTHSASDITSGILATTRLGSGTPSSSNFLRGDGTWAAIDTSGLVPTSRTLTINGTTQNLSANRTWNVGTVTSVAMTTPTGLTVSGSPITSAGTLALGLQSGYSIPTTAKQTQWDKVVTDFDELEIGGRNLITNSLSHWVVGSLSTSTGADFTSTTALRSPYVELDEGNYVLSTLFKDRESDENLNVWIHFYNENKVGGRYINWQMSNPINFEILQGEQYVRVLLRIYIDDVAQDISLDELGTRLFVQLEKGNKATDWTPAPEDQVSDWSTTDVDSFSFIKNKPTLLSQFTDNIGVATHIANTSNPHNVTKAQVGLGSVDNTSDLNKPISNATQTALNLKANLASPTFTGVVTAPTFSGALSGNATTATTATNLSRSIIAGNGLSGGGVLNADRTITLGTPSTITSATTNSITASSHTHAIDGSNLDVRSSNHLRVDNIFDVNNASVDALKFKVYDSYGVAGTPSTYGNILEVNGIAGHWKPQLWFDGGRDGKVRYRNKAYNASTFGSWNVLAYITDNVASATKLQTPRTIWGQSFDGTGNVTGALSGATTITASTSVTSPKVIFNAAGWSMEQVGSELQMKHNNVLKMRFTSTGSMIATEEVTAFG